jgi:hypothetical protein
VLDKFWGKLGEGLAGEWNLRLLTPGFAFLGGLALLWIWRNGWDDVGRVAREIDPTTGAAFLLAGSFLLSFSAALVSWLARPILRLAEGYWPGWLWGLRRRQTERVNRMVAEKSAEWDGLAEQFYQNSLQGASYERYIRLDRELANYPVNLHIRMPTVTGNILRAAEEYPERAYKLEILTTWPRLWLALPESSRKELSESRQTLNWNAQLLTWGVAYLLVGAVFLAQLGWRWFEIVPLALVVIPGLAVILSAWRRLRSAAEVFGELLRAAYDLHRFSLYEGLRWPLPENPHAEDQLGQALVLYLKRNEPPAALPGKEEQFVFQHK